MDFKVLAVGDVVGNPGMDRVCHSLRYLKRKTEADFVVVNGENASVVGMTPRQAEDVLDAGLHVRLPYPLEKTDVYNNKTISKVTIGYQPDVWEQWIQDDK